MNEGKSLEAAEFEDYNIRRIWDEETERWWFAVVDVIEALTDSNKPRNYWYDLKRREKAKSGVELSAICRQFKLKSPNKRFYNTECADTEGIFRIIQSIPSPKAEPFKLWLARVGYERLQEIENPELAAERARQLYKAQGYSDEWIERRLQSIVTRNELTDEWKERGVKEGQEYAVLTADIARETFGITPTEHKKVKKLKRESLRDHMTGLELAFTILGEAATTEITRQDDAQGFNKNQVAARKGGRIAGNARRELEAETGKPVVSPTNYLERPEAEQEQLPAGEEDDSGSPF
ncbi:MAG: Bro-N domain-containing protein [Chloroflexi bacterium]|nr:Bro-N domain-containing protein [Chloroflexota bacterium]MCI0650007.1 Bro-N domain-containing protein [Chloroflexota bacterium]MCI0730471.1 Bro-N domain-containing protein [Chloroflexota bacterium]